MDVKSMRHASKLLDGWQAGLVVIVVALLSAIVAVPRPVVPDEIPYPVANRRILSRISEIEESRARALAVDKPNYDVRALGEAFRAYGLADADGDTERTVQRLRAVQISVPDALKAGEETILKLRAYQLTLFLEALRQYESTGAAPAEMRELGGGFLAMALRAGWVRKTASGSSFIMEPAVREALFRKRWNEITGLKGGGFTPSLDEVRVLYSFLLSHPIAQSSRATPTLSPCSAANEYMLRKVAELGQIDSEYPTPLAQAILLLRLDRPREAVDALAHFAESEPGGRFTLRARNTLREAQERLLRLAKP
jgi:hypothetical protein